MSETSFQCQRFGVNVRSYAYWNYRTIPPTLIGAGPHCMYCQEGKNIVTRNTEMVKGTDVVDWLRAERDMEAAERKKLFTEVQRRDDAVKLGVMTAAEAAGPNQLDIVAANARDARALCFFTALTEIARSRKIIAEMTKALRDREHYVEEGR